MMLQIGSSIVEFRSFHCLFCMAIMHA